MPVLKWIDNGAMVRRDAEVPFQLLHPVRKFQCGWVRVTEVVSMRATLPSMMT
jgi:hypothetical protein